MKKRVQGITAAFMAVSALGLTGCDEQDLRDTMNEFFPDTSQSYTLDPLPVETPLPMEPPAPEVSQTTEPSIPSEDAQEPEPENEEPSVPSLTPEAADKSVSAVIRNEEYRTNFFNKILEGECYTIFNLDILSQKLYFCINEISTYIEVNENRAEMGVCLTYDADHTHDTLRYSRKDADILDHTTCEIQPSPTILV